MQNTPTDDTHASDEADDEQSLEALLALTSAELRESLEREAEAETRHAAELVKARRSLDRGLAVSLVTSAVCLAAGVAVGVML